jgi:hypothetical protein
MTRLVMHDDSRKPAALLALIATAIALTPVRTTAQTVPNREAAAEVRKQFLADLDTLHHKFVALAGAFPAAKFAWRPAPGVRSVGEAFMHVAAEYYTYVPSAYGAAPSPVPGPESASKQFEATGTKAEVLKQLDAGYAYTTNSLKGIDPARLAGTHTIWGAQRTIIETSLGPLDDLHEHLGQLIAYARMNGVTPPWSK